MASLLSVSFFDAHGTKRTHNEALNPKPDPTLDKTRRLSEDLLKKRPLPVFADASSFAPPFCPPTPARPVRPARRSFPEDIVSAFYLPPTPARPLRKAQAAQSPREDFAKMATQSRTLVSRLDMHPNPHDIGSYKQVYFLTDRLTRETLVYKFYRTERDSERKRYLQWTKTSLEQIKALQQTQLHFAPFLNDPLIDGYFTQHYFQPLSELPKEALSAYLGQLAQFFITAISKELPLDIRVDNFGIDEGRVILFDFLEDDDEGHDVMITTALRKWKEYLTGDDSQLYDQLIKQIFTSRDAKHRQDLIPK